MDALYSLHADKRPQLGDGVYVPGGGLIYSYDPTTGDTRYQGPGGGPMPDLNTLPVPATPATPAPVGAAAPAVTAPTAAQAAQSQRESVESYRKSLFLLSQPGFDFGSGAQKRNDFYGVSGMNDSGLGASFDIVSAVLTAAKATAPQLKGITPTSIGIHLPTLPAPVMTFGQTFLNVLKKQASGAPTNFTATDPAGNSRPPAPAASGFPWGKVALLGGLGVGAFLIVRRLRK